MLNLWILEPRSPAQRAQNKTRCIRGMRAVTRAHRPRPAEPTWIPVRRRRRPEQWHRPVGHRIGSANLYTEEDFAFVAVVKARYATRYWIILPRDPQIDMVNLPNESERRCPLLLTHTDLPYCMLFQINQLSAVQQCSSEPG